MIASAHQVEVPQRSLSQIIQEQGLQRVDLLKVDVERAEVKVLQGIAPQHWSILRQVSMEVHQLTSEEDQAL
ncbi:methyltransferase, FkbM family/non-ribosomal peptide synthase domain TIGR01720/amino acid adenylation domain-containing protein, partial [Haematococcus lacustris]